MWKIIHEYEVLFEKAPVKRGWNSTFRQQIPSQSDVNRKRDAILANMNDNCKRMTGKDLVAEDIYAVLVALKLSRHSYNYREDNLLDAVAYLASLNDYINNKKEEL